MKKQTNKQTKKTPSTKHPRNLEHYEKTKRRNNRNRERRKKKSQLKGPENIFNKIIEENFPYLKNGVPVKVQERYKT